MPASAGLGPACWPLPGLAGHRWSLGRGAHAYRALWSETLKWAPLLCLLALLALLCLLAAYRGAVVIEVDFWIAHAAGEPARGTHTHR